MTRGARLVMVGGSLWAAACSCGEPALPAPPPDPDEQTGDTAVTETAETGLELPCDVPEREPNDVPAEANPLPTDDEACGGFGVDGDFDYWLVSVEEPSWLEIRLEGANASLADVGLLVTSESGAIGVGRDDGFEDPDVLLLFPAVPDLYTLAVREEQAKSGERYMYEMLVSVAKSPVFFDAEGTAIDWVDEPEPNDAPTGAPSLRDGDAVLGGASAPFDVDWYQVGVPAGKHTLRFDVQAWNRGSGGNFTLSLFDASLELVRSAAGGANPADLDPVLEYNSAGDEVLYLQVREADNRGNPAIWYLLQTQVETETE